MVIKITSRFFGMLGAAACADAAGAAAAVVVALVAAIADPPEFTAVDDGFAFCES
jgi:hypothetical protein